MRVGLVLSGGAARGFAHLGVFKALEELHIPIHIISGTSSGAMAGALYGAGYAPEEIFRMVSETNIVRLMRPAFSKLGLMNLDEVEKMFHRFLQDKTFADLRFKLIIAATDIRQGILVYFSDGEIVKPLVAASSVPILYKPIFYRDHLLCDGGLLNNFPVECLLGESDFIIGVHTNPMNHHVEPRSFRHLMERTFHLAINNNVEPRLKHCHFLIEPPDLKNYSLLNIRKAREMFMCGYDHTMFLADKLQARMAAVQEQKDSK
jgi:NTE family protein